MLKVKSQKMNSEQKFSKENKIEGHSKQSSHVFEGNGLRCAWKAYSETACCLV